LIAEQNNAFPQFAEKLLEIEGKEVPDLSELPWLNQC
jgi:hypothetical protein